MRLRIITTTASLIALLVGPSFSKDLPPALDAQPKQKGTGVPALDIRSKTVTIEYERLILLVKPYILEAQACRAAVEAMTVEKEIAKQIEEQKK